MPEYSTTESELTYQELHAASVVMFSHDHVRTAAHFDNALAGGVTAMTMELTVDNVKWTKNFGVCGTNGFCPGTQWCADDGQCWGEVVGPVGAGAVQSTITPGYPFQSQWSAATRFAQALTDLTNIIVGSSGKVLIVKKVEDIDFAKANGKLGIIIGTEGALMLSGNYPEETPATVLSNIEARYMDGWRKVLLYRVYATPFVAYSPASQLSDLGRRVVPMLNKRGVVIDAMHLDGGHLDDLFPRTSAPLQVSHEWAACGAPGRLNKDRLLKIAASGGGYGVVSINALTATYTPPPPPAPPPVDLNGVACPTPPAKNVTGFVDTLEQMLSFVSIDNIAIGPDYMPEGSSAPGASYAFPIEQTATITEQLKIRNWTDVNIKKVLGGNLRNLYQRIWDPTHGHTGGTARFQLCSNVDQSAVCLAARSKGGQGDLFNRAINCAHPSGLTPVGMKLAFHLTQPQPPPPALPTGKWVFKNLAGAWIDCATAAQGGGANSGSTLVATLDPLSGPSNGRFAIHGSAACDASCQQAINYAGAGTTSARALSCKAANSNGIVGLQLAYTYAGGTYAWRHYDLNSQLQACAASSTFVANWGASVPSPNAKLRLCDDYNGHADCAAAASNGGSGTAQAKALNCLSTTPTWNSARNEYEHAAVALQVFYQDVWLQTDENNPNSPWIAVPGGGHWQYWDTDFKAHPCVHGSVLVGTTL